MTDKLSSLCRRPGRWLMAAVLSLGSSLALAQPFQPFTASYAADMKNIPVNGEAVHSLAQNADGTWSLNFHASMFVARLTEESTLRLEGEEVVPLTYRYQRKGLGLAGKPPSSLTGPMAKYGACTRRKSSPCRPNPACWTRPPTSWRCSAI